MTREEMTREEALKHLQAAKLMLLGKDILGKDNRPISDLYYALNIAIEALEQEPCEDAVSRQEAIHCVTETELYNETFAEVKMRIAELKPVLPKRKRGEWKQNGTGYDDEPIYECSKCGKRVIFGADGYFKGCPYCFAEMAEGGD